MLRLKLSRERNSRLNWNDNLGAIFEVNLKSNLRAVPVPFNVFALRGYNDYAKIHDYGKDGDCTFSQ